MTRSSAIAVLLLAHVLCTYGQLNHPLLLNQGPVRLGAEVLEERETGSFCPAEQDTLDAKAQLRQNISAILAGVIPYECGGTPGWRRVSYLDMTDPSETCPPGLAFRNFTSTTGLPTVRTLWACWYGPRLLVYVLQCWWL